MGVCGGGEGWWECVWERRGGGSVCRRGGVVGVCVGGEGWWECVGEGRGGVSVWGRGGGARILISFFVAFRV